jgi:hypothetical protein
MKLSEFLKEHHAYDKFVNNFSADPDFNCYGGDVDIDNAFNWKDSQEGHIFWMELEDILYDQYNNIEYDMNFLLEEKQNEKH